MFTAPRIFRPTGSPGVARRVVLTAVGAAAMSLLAIESHAAEFPRRVTVNYEGIDLVKRANAENLYARLRAAARAVCIEPGGGQLSQLRRYRTCYADTLSQAVARIDHASVTALFNSDKAVRVAQYGTDSQRRT